MKRVVLDGAMVVNVEAVADDETDGMIVADEVWVGPGTVWNGDETSPAFSPPPEAA